MKQVLNDIRCSIGEHDYITEYSGSIDTDRCFIAVSINECNNCGYINEAEDPNSCDFRLWHRYLLNKGKFMDLDNNCSIFLKCEYCLNNILFHSLFIEYLQSLVIENPRKVYFNAVQIHNNILTLSK